MRIDILTLFPEMFEPLRQSIIGRARREGKIEINVVNIRDYTEDRHLKCDDYPFGGGAGMVMMAQPIGSAIEAIDPNHEARRIYATYLEPGTMYCDPRFVKEVSEALARAFGKGVTPSMSYRVSASPKLRRDTPSFLDTSAVRKGLSPHS